MSYSGSQAVCRFGSGNHSSCHGSPFGVGGCTKRAAAIASPYRAPRDFGPSPHVDRPGGAVRFFSTKRLIRSSRKSHENLIAGIKTGDAFLHRLSMTEMGLGCVKTQTRSVAAEETLVQIADSCANIS